MRINAKNAFMILLIAGLVFTGCQWGAIAAVRSGFTPSTATPTYTPIPTLTPTPTPTPMGTPSAGEPNTLRYLASKRGFLIGSAVDAKALDSDWQYAALLSRELNVVVPENVMKFANIHPTPDSYNFAPADQLVSFAEGNGMLVRAHTLLWYQSDPEWVKEGDYSPAELENILHNHINSVVSRYKGRIFAWDVINEEVSENGELRDNVWLRGIGPQYIDLAFQWAHEADPNALLFYNDDSHEQGAGVRSDAIYNLVKRLRNRGVPIDGVGIQMHVSLGSAPSIDDLETNIERLGLLGLVVHITEMDVRLSEPADPESLDAQAQVYRDVLDACLFEANVCKALVMWGLTDKYSWIPNAYAGFGSALIFDANFQPKPAYAALQEVLAASEP